MTSKNWYTKDYRSDYGQRIYILKKITGKSYKICTKTTPLQTEPGKVLTTASTSRTYVTPTCLTNLIGIYKRSKEDLAFSKGIFLSKTSERQPFISLGFRVLVVGKSTSRTFQSCRHEPLKARRWSW